LEGWIAVGGIVLFLSWLVWKTKRRNSDPQMRETVSVMENYARGYFSQPEFERKERDASLLKYLYLKKTQGAGLRELVHPVTMLANVLSTDERAQLAKITELVYSYDLPASEEQSRPAANADFVSELGSERPYQIAPDGRISMCWTVEATRRTAKTGDWVFWEIEDPEFVSRQTIFAWSGLDTEFMKPVRSIVWADEDIGLVILDDIGAEETGQMFPFPGQFIYDRESLNQ
jgi:hypothetical protein